MPAAKSTREGSCRCQVPWKSSLGAYKKIESRMCGWYRGSAMNFLQGVLPPTKKCEGEAGPNLITTRHHSPSTTRCPLFSHSGWRPFHPRIDPGDATFTRCYCTIALLRYFDSIHPPESSGAAISQTFQNIARVHKFVEMSQ